MLMWGQPPPAVRSSEARLVCFAPSANGDYYTETNVALYDSAGRVALRLRRGCGFCRLHLVAHAFHFTKHAQNIPAENLLDVAGAVTAIE